nr:hypothetical protein [Azospirillum argentinense]
MCRPLEIRHTVEPDPALAAALAPRRRLFRRLYGDLSAAFREADGV